MLNGAERKTAYQQVNNFARDRDFENALAVKKALIKVFEDFIDFE